MNKKQFIYSNLLAWGLIILLVGNYVFGWTSPSENPPGGNITPSFSQWTTSGNDIYYIDGNVGVGTDSPKTKLDVAGGIKIGSEDTCNVNTTGVIRYNSSGKKFEGCDGEEWKLIADLAPPASVSIKANNSYDSILVGYNTAVSLSWTSSNAISCYASEDWSGEKSIQGSESTGNLTSSKT